MELIDKSAVENILRELWIEDREGIPLRRIYYNKALQEVQCKLDTLEVKEVDLEKEFDDYIEKQNAFTNNDNSEIKYYNGDSFDHVYDIYPIAKHFFELGVKAMKGE